MAVKRALDIEALLHWAYRDELPKRHTSSAEGIWNKLGRIATLGIDPGQRTATAAQRYAHLGVPHEDAIEIEKTVGKLQPAMIDWKRHGRFILGELFGMLPIEQTSSLAQHAACGTSSMGSRAATLPSDDRTQQDQDRYRRRRRQTRGAIRIASAPSSRLVLREAQRLGDLHKTGMPSEVLRPGFRNLVHGPQASGQYEPVTRRGLNLLPHEQGPVATSSTYARGAAREHGSQKSTSRS
jgi:hypothetical protein